MKKMKQSPVISVYLMLVAGIALCGTSFFTPPVGEISPSAMNFMGEALIYAASVFGLTHYVDYRINRLGK